MDELSIKQLGEQLVELLDHEMVRLSDNECLQVVLEAAMIITKRDKGES